MFFVNRYKNITDKNIYLAEKIAYSYFGMKVFSFSEEEEKINYLVANINENYNSFHISKSSSISSNKEIFNLLVNLCIKKGNKKLALKMIKKSFLLIREFFWINVFLLLRLILIKSESVFILQRYKLGKREKIIPRFIPFGKKMKYVFRMLVKHAVNVQKEYKYFYISLAYSIIEFSMPGNMLEKVNRQENELAEANKFFLYKKKKKRRKVRLFRKINDWK